MRLHSLLRRRPSPAMLIASAALFISLGGVGYAATQIPNGSVGTAQLRNNAVTYKKIAQGTVGSRRINTGQVQVRVGGTCASGGAIGAIDSGGKVTCNSTPPAQFGTTNNIAAVPTGATSPTSVTSVSLPGGASYLALGNPTATVTSTDTGGHVHVTCTLTVGSNTETRATTIDTTGTSGETSSASIPLQATGGSGTAGVACQSSATGGGTAPAVSVTSAINAIQIAGS